MDAVAVDVVVVHVVVAVENVVAQPVVVAKNAVVKNVAAAVLAVVGADVLDARVLFGLFFSFVFKILQQKDFY